jgi:hypothetical protein
MQEKNIRACAHCGQTFEVKAHGKHRRFCSDACRAASWRRLRSFRGSGTANQQALEEMLAGYVVPASLAAVVQAARSLARAVDQHPLHSGLWARYQAALAALQPLVARHEEDEFAALLAEIQGDGPAVI